MRFITLLAAIASLLLISEGPIGAQVVTPGAPDMRPVLKPPVVRKPPGPGAVSGVAIASIGLTVSSVGGGGSPVIVI